MKLEERIEEIEKRNKRVELDKAWETSFVRRVCIAVLIYLIVVFYSYLISKNNNLYLSILVPVIGFLLSILSLRFVRKIWKKNK